MKQFIQRFTLLIIMTLAFAPIVSASSEPIDIIRALIHEYYVDEVPRDVLEKDSIKEITDLLDPYSIYMDAAEYNHLTNGIEQRIVGVGIVLKEDTKGIKVVSVIPGGPAERAGVQSGDIITHADGKNLIGESTQTAVSLISGKEHTTVILHIERNGRVYFKTIKREVVHLPNVETKLLGGNIGYIKLNSFSMDASKEIEAAIHNLGDVQGWIMDVRNNSGGYITAAQSIAGYFPNVNYAFQLRYKDGLPFHYESVNQPLKFRKPTHLLINEFSASASEMLASAVKAQNGATLYGQTSFGKGTMQSIFELKDGSVLKLTTARFFSPSGQKIDQVGVKPDVFTEKGNELETSHKDQIISTLSDYKKLATLESVPINKKFTVKTNTDMLWDENDLNAIQLIQLGGEKHEVEIEFTDPKTLTIIPKGQLISGGKYLLIIHPYLKNTYTTMKQGAYLEVSVE